MKGIYDRLSALELEQSSCRSDGQSLRRDFERLREGCKLLETKADSANDKSTEALTAVKTVIKCVKKAP